MGAQNFAVVNLDGGLNLIDTHMTNQQRVGTCKVLDNFESSINGGYRKINGYTMYGTAQPSGGANTVFGTFPYADGVLAISSDGVYFSDDGITWIQVNRDTYVVQTGTVEVGNAPSGTYVDVNGSGTTFLADYSVGDHIRIAGTIAEIASVPSDTYLTISTEISGGVVAGTAHYKNGDLTPTGTLLPRTSQGTTEFAWLEADGEYGSIVFTDTTGNNNAGRFQITGLGGTRFYYYDDLDANFGAPTNPRHCISFQQRVVFGDIVLDSVREIGTIAWSDRYQNKRFDGASAGTANTGTSVVGLAPFKDKLIIFAHNHISQLVNINDVATIAIIPITTHTGCISAQTIQVMANDVIFLSYDGIRVLSASDLYGDITFGIISLPIDEYVKTIINGSSGFDLSSCMIRNKNQYRLFYTNSLYSTDQQRGVIGTLKRNSQGGMEWQWSRAKSFVLSCLTSTASPFVTVGAKEERIYQGGYDGYVYTHDSGNSFGGNNIRCTMELNEIDYGDAGLKKTLHYVKVFGSVEG